MTFINDVINNFILLLIVAIVVATIVGQKFAEKYPGDAKRLQIRAGQSLAGWLKKWFK